jgi:arginase family enzyme
MPLAENSVSRADYDRAPAAIRSRLDHLSTYDSIHKIELLDLPVIDLGDSLEPPTLGADLTIILGGHNGVTFRVLGNVPQLDRWGLVTIDAHHDVRPYRPGAPGNGSPVRALIEAGLPGRNIVQIGINGFSNSLAHYQWCVEQGIIVQPLSDIEATSDHINALASRCDALYVDLDLDVLDRSFAPGCPGSRPGGATPSQLFSVAHLAGACPAVKAIDIVEVDPNSDVASVTVDNAAITLLYAASGYQARRRFSEG